MRAWRIIGKYKIYDDDGNISHTEIAITTTSGQQASITERVIGDHTEKNDEELIALVCDAFFKSEYADKAMAESVQKIDELEQTIRENKKLTEELKKAIAKSEAGLIENRQTIDTAVAELTGLMMGMMGISEPVEGAEDEESIE